MSDLRFPIGEFTKPGPLTREQRVQAIDTIAAAPERLRKAVSSLSDEQLDTHYRPGGWTVRQVVHHLPDSHMNALIRFKIALTEDYPTVRTYEEALFAELPDARLPVDVSLDLLDTVHARWVHLLRALTDDDWELRFVHPDSGEFRVDELAAMYAWHGEHHIAHITSLAKREGWS